MFPKRTPPIRRQVVFSYNKRITIRNKWMKLRRKETDIHQLLVNNLKRFPEPGISCVLQWPWIVLLQWRAEIKAIVLWVVTLWSVVEIFRRFWGNFCLRIQGWKILCSLNEGRFCPQTISEFSQVLCLRNVAVSSSERYVYFYHI